MFKAVQKFGTKVLHRKGKAKASNPVTQPAEPSRFSSPPREDVDAFELTRVPVAPASVRDVPAILEAPSLREDADAVEAGPSQQPARPILPPYTVVTYGEFGSRPDLRRFKPLPGEVEAAHQTLQEDACAMAKSIKAGITQVRKLGSTAETAELVIVLWKDRPKAKKLEAVAPSLRHPVIVVSAKPMPA